MQYPNISEYTKAISNAEDNFDKLKDLRPVLDKQGEPMRSVGGFAVVFKMIDKDTQKEFAIKCFHEEQVGRANIYSEISKALAKNKSHYLMNVRFLEKELFVDSSVTNETEFPVLQMDWVEGETMESFISSHYKDTGAIYQLYLKFCDLATWLRSKPFAHGDLKPDNIMVRSNGTLTLVDYDGMFVPSLAGTKSPTLGTHGFYHPQRKASDFDATIDDFALATISISLFAMSQDASLYKDLGAPDRLLFSDLDYTDFANSKAYKRVTALGGLFPKLLSLFNQCIANYDKSSGKLYDQIFDIQTKAPEISSFSCSQGDTVYEGDTINLHWSVLNATKLTIDNNDVTDANDFKIKLSQSREFKLIAYNGIKESQRKIKINTVKSPTIKFKSNANKLRKGKDDTIRLTWVVNNCHSIELIYDKTHEKVNKQGEKVLHINKTTEIHLDVIGLDTSRHFEKVVRVSLYNEAEVQFTADKLYTMPSVPVTLSWNVQHAKDIELIGFGKVNKQGIQIVEPKETTEYKLRITDAFGRKEQSIKIQILPIPRLMINVPAPEVTNPVNLKISIESPKVFVQFPKTNLMGIELDMPHVPDWAESGLNIKLSDKLSSVTSVWSELKSLYSHYKNKLIKYGRQ
jgi:serine/threonine protein kinase